MSPGSSEIPGSTESPGSSEIPRSSDGSAGAGPTQPGSPTKPGRDGNLFDLLRLVAAAAVIVGHAWPITGTAGVPEIAGIRIHHLGVYVFFTISGFLLTQSWRRDPHAAPFLVRRCARIFPALIVTVILTVAVLGPLATTARDYGMSPETWAYLSNLVLVASYELPGVFASHPLTAVNGSLWSLGPEFCCYLLIAALGIAGARIRLGVRLALAVAGVAGAMLTTGPLRITVFAATMFVLGSLLAEWERRRPMPLWPVPVIAAGTLLVGEGASALFAPAIAYAAIATGIRRSRLASIVRRAGDPSYGMYLWGFPVQQLLVGAGIASVAANAVLALGIATAAGYASWHLVEHRAIRAAARVRRNVRTSA